ARRTHIGLEALVDGLERQRVGAEKSCSGSFVQVRLDRCGTEERLTETDDPFVGVDPDIEEIRVRAYPYGLQLGDLHVVTSEAVTVCRSNSRRRQEARSRSCRTPCRCTGTRTDRRRCSGLGARRGRWFALPGSGTRGPRPTAGSPCLPRRSPAARRSSGSRRAPTRSRS